MKLLCSWNARDCASLASRATLHGTLLAALAAPTVRAGADDPWPLAGQQGIVRSVIVPMDQARDRAAYVRQVQLLCQPNQTCFLNFYTNSTGAPLSMPLPDAISNESTAAYRRSTKQGSEIFRWNCRLQIPKEDCF
jgi:hypothetical protein